MCVRERERERELTTLSHKCHISEDTPRPEHTADRRTHQILVALAYCSHGPNATSRSAQVQNTYNKLTAILVPHQCRGVVGLLQNLWDGDLCCRETAL